MCRNVKIKLTYLKVRLSLRLVRSLRTIRGRFKRFPVGVVPPLERSGRPASSLHSHNCSIIIIIIIIIITTRLVSIEARKKHGDKGH